MLCFQFTWLIDEEKPRTRVRPAPLSYANHDLQAILTALRPAENRVYSDAYKCSALPAEVLRHLDAKRWNPKSISDEDSERFGVSARSQSRFLMRLAPNIDYEGAIPIQVNSTGFIKKGQTVRVPGADGPKEVCVQQLTHYQTRTVFIGDDGLEYVAQLALDSNEQAYVLVGRATSYAPYPQDGRALGNSDTYDNPVMLAKSERYYDIKAEDPNLVSRVLAPDVYRLCIASRGGLTTLSHGFNARYEDGEQHSYLITNLFLRSGPVEVRRSGTGLLVDAAALIRELNRLYASIPANAQLTGSSADSDGRLRIKFVWSVPGMRLNHEEHADIGLRAELVVDGREAYLLTRAFDLEDPRRRSFAAGLLTFSNIPKSSSSLQFEFNHFCMIENTTGPDGTRVIGDVTSDGDRTVRLHILHPEQVLGAEGFNANAMAKRKYGAVFKEIASGEVDGLMIYGLGRQDPNYCMGARKSGDNKITMDAGVMVYDLLPSERAPGVDLPLAGRVAGDETDPTGGAQVSNLGRVRPVRLGP